MSDPGNPKEPDPRKAVSAQIRDEIQKRLEPVPQLKDLPEPAKTTVVEQVTEVAIAVSHSTWEGNYPPPSVIREFEQIEPGLAGRIFRMAEEELAHARLMDLRLADYMGRGQLFGFLLALVAIVGSIYLVAIGERVIGGLLSAAILIPIVTLFVKGNIKFGDSAGGNGETPKTVAKPSNSRDDDRRKMPKNPKRKR